MTIGRMPWKIVWTLLPLGVAKGAASTSFLLDVYSYGSDCEHNLSLTGCMIKYPSEYSEFYGGFAHVYTLSRIELV